MTVTRRVIGAAALGVTATLVALAPPAFATEQVPALPTPTGSHPVGTTSHYLKDTSRADPWVPEVPFRELMVSLFYPARSTGAHRASYLTPRESQLILEDAGITGVPYDILSKTRIDAYTDAPPSGRPAGTPLIVLSPGFGNPRSELTGLAEDLASNGYVVVTIDHTYDSVATTFPDGRVTTCVACEVPDHDPTFWKKVDHVRAADVSFVLDRLTAPHRAWPAAALIDPSRIAMAGHSAGGSATQTAMVADRRIRAGIDMDGLTNGTLPDTGLSRPFLFLGRQNNFTPGMPSAAAWEGDWPHLTGWKRWLVVSGAIHPSFTDLSLLADQLGIDLGADLSGNRGLQITRTYVRAFFDQHLRSRPQPLLNAPSPAYPEVAFCSPKSCAPMPPDQHG